MAVSWGPRNKAPHDPSVCVHSLEARVQDQAVGRAGSFWALPRSLPRLSPSLWRFTGDLQGSLAYRVITPTPASVFTRPPLCACLHVQICRSYEVTSHVGLGPTGFQRDLILTTSPTTLFRNKVPF